MESCQSPRRVKMCDGMCSACGRRARFSRSCERQGARERQAAANRSCQSSSGPCRDVRRSRRTRCQNFGGLLLVGVILVGWRRGGDQSQREEDRGFSILRIARGESLHCLALCARAPDESVGPCLCRRLRWPRCSRVRAGSGAHRLRFLDRGLPIFSSSVFGGAQMG